MIENILNYVLPCSINIFTVIFIQKSMLKKKLDFKDYRLYLGTFLLILFSILSFISITGFLRFVLSFIYISIISMFIFREKMYTTFSVTVLEQTIFFLSELVCAVLFSVFKLNILSVANDGFLYSLFVNGSVSLVALILYSIKYVSYLCDKIMQLLYRISPIKKVIIIFVFFITLNVLLMLMYFSNENRYIIFINSIFIVVYSVIIYMLINEKSENVKFKQENEMLLDNLSDYEKMLDYQRVNNHENKNQLLVVRSMISKNNTKALDYLDEVINEKRKDDEGLYTYAKTIPEGGLQGLVYQKMLKMKENNIKINLNVNRKIRKVNFDNISSKTNYDLCRIVGVILDNAIEEVMKLEDKEILISMYKDTEHFIIEVSNKCESIPDLSKLDEKGYTTKSEGHGYGLSLLKEIIGNNDTFINERSINKNIFTQIIKIKM